MSTLTALISGGGGEVTAVVPVNGIAQLNVEENLYTDSENRVWLRNGSLITTGLENYPDAIVKNDLISLSYNDRDSNISLAENRSLATGFCFSSDGLNLYFTEYYETIVQYTLSAAYKGGTKTSTKKKGGFPQGTDSAIQISNDGTKFYMTNATTLKYYELTTPYDITTATLIQDVTLDGSSRGFKFSPDGLKMFIAQGTNGVREYNLVSPWNPIGLTYAGYRILNGSDTFDITWKEDGTKFYILYLTTGSVREYNCTTPFSFSGGSSVVGTKTDVLNNANYGKAFFLVPDSTGNRFYGCDFTNIQVIFLFSASTPYTITTLTPGLAFPAYQTLTGSPYSSTYPAIFNYDGTKVYAANNATGSTYYQFSCPIPFDVSTATYDSIASSIGSTQVEWTNNGNTFISQPGSTTYVKVARTPYVLAAADPSYTISSSIGGTLVNNGYQSVWISSSTPNTANISYSTTKYIPNGTPSGTFNQSDSSYVDYKIGNPAYTIDGKYVFSAPTSGASTQYLLDAPFSMNIVNPVGSGPSGLYGKIKEYNGYWGGTASNIYNLYKKVNYIGFFSGNVNDFVRIK